MQYDSTRTVEIINLVLPFSFLFLCACERESNAVARPFGSWQLARTATRFCSLDEGPGSRGD